LINLYLLRIYAITLHIATALTIRTLQSSKQPQHAQMIDTQYTLAGALTGFVVGLTGVGGGALMTPLLLLIFGVSPATAIATDLWFAVATKLVAAHIHGAGGQVDWVVVKRMWYGSLPAALLVVVGVSAGVSVEKIGWLTQAIGLIVMFTAVGMLLAPRLLRAARGLRLNNPEKFKASQPQLTVAAGALLGLCVALTSVGAGALGSVMLLYLYPLRMTPHKLIATDLAHAIALAMVAGSGYLVAGLVDSMMLLSLLAGSVPAVALGSHLAKRLDGRRLQIILALALLIIGLKML
jgi:uncharacterized protein